MIHIILKLKSISDLEFKKPLLITINVSSKWVTGTNKNYGIDCKELTIDSLITAIYTKLLALKKRLFNGNLFLSPEEIIIKKNLESLLGN